MKAIHWHDPRSMKEQVEKDNNKKEEENKEQRYNCRTCRFLERCPPCRFLERSINRNKIKIL